jgi:Spy/CpxP family protein refolding chaperone
MKFRMGAMAVVGALVCVSLAFGQPGRGQGGRGGAGGFGGGGFGGFGQVRTSDLLRDDKVKAELNLVPDQEKKIEDLAEANRDKAREFFGSLRDLSDEERTAKIEEFRAQTQKEYDAILLPQQRDRLKQLMLQRSSQFSRGPGGLSDDLMKELNITDAQKEALTKKAEDIRADVQKKVAKIQDEAKAEILSVLTSEQRAKLEKLMGSKFEFSPPQFGGFGGQGGQGGRPGQGGQGNRPLQRPADGD